MKETIKRLYNIGLGHVFGAYTINKIIAFATNFVIVRLLSKNEYGFFSSAFNIYSFFNIFTGLGMLGAELLFCTEEREEKERRAIYRYTLLAGLVSNIILGIGIVAYGTFGPNSIPESRKYIIMFSGLLAIEYFAQFVLCYYRTKKNNKAFSWLSTLNSVTYFAFGGIGALILGVEGTIIGRYLAYIIVASVGIYYLRDNISDLFNRNRLDKKLKKDIWTYSLKNGASTFLNQVIYLIDVFLISTIIADSEIVASYKFATIIPESLSFIPQAIMVALIPYFVSNMRNNNWIKTSTRKLLLYTGTLNIVITVTLIISAPIVIQIAGGEKYADSLIYYRILSISYFFLATFRLMSTSLLSVFRKTTYNLFVAAITGILNILLDYIMISKYQAVGAAWATVLSVVIGSVLSFPYLMHIINSNKLGYQNDWRGMIDD